MRNGGDGYCTPCGECPDCVRDGQRKHDLIKAKRRIKSLEKALRHAQVSLEMAEETWRSMADEGQTCAEADSLLPAIRLARRVLKVPS